MLEFVLGAAVCLMGWWNRRLIRDVERLEDALEEAVFSNPEV